MKKKIVLGLMAVVIFLCTPPAATLRSMCVMSLYSAWCGRDSIEKREGFRLEIPGGMRTGERDWYPLSLLYDASEEFAWRTGTDTRLNIYYTFPAYDLWKGCSMLYDTDSQYYSSFYGAYLVQGEEDSRRRGRSLWKRSRRFCVLIFLNWFWMIWAFRRSRRHFPGS